MEVETEVQTERIVEISCRDCGARVTAREIIIPVLGRAIRSRAICDDCAQQIQLDREQDRLHERHNEWLRICPKEFRAIDPEKLPSDSSRSALAMALEWEKAPPRPGLGLMGLASGLGKTRIAFAAMYPHFLAGASVAHISGTSFQVECSARWGDKLKAWLGPLKAAGILLLDDLGKEKVTEHVAAALFDVVNERTNNQRPIVLTSNHTSFEIESKYPQHGPYIVRRLRDYCRFIEIE